MPGEDGEGLILGLGVPVGGAPLGAGSPLGEGEVGEGCVVGLVCCVFGCPGVVCPGLVWPGLVWPGLVCVGLVCPGLVMPGEEPEGDVDCAPPADVLCAALNAKENATTVKSAISRFMKYLEFQFFGFRA